MGQARNQTMSPQGQKHVWDLIVSDLRKWPWKSHIFPSVCLNNESWSHFILSRLQISRESPVSAAESLNEVPDRGGGLSDRIAHSGMSNCHLSIFGSFDVLTLGFWPIPDGSRGSDISFSSKKLKWKLVYGRLLCLPSIYSTNL